MVLRQINDMIWGPWMLLFIIGTGIFLSFKLKNIPLKNLSFALDLFIKAFTKKDSKTPTLEPIMTSLAAMMGTGNILGVSTALILGGPGALLWMNIAALIGITITYAENMISVKYQQKDAQGNYFGGPMYVLLKTKMPFKKLMAGLFALFTICASIGMGNLTQSNCAANELKEAFQIPTIATGLILGLLALTIFFSKATTIGKVCTYLVPLMSAVYGISLIIIIILCRANLSNAINTIIKSAFYPKAFVGGIGGFSAIRWGMARGIFSNEAGMGSSAIALASTPSTDYVKQGYLSMTNVFFDTMVMCSLTGLAILSSGIYGMVNNNGKTFTGTNLIHQVFVSTLGQIGGYIITLCIVLFAFATIIGWSYYGKIALNFLIKSKSQEINIYSIIYALFIFIGAVCSVENIWNFSDICNGLMIIPNLISLLYMSNEIKKDTIDYEKKKSLLKRRTSHYRANRFLK